jgi:hypothetical protein
MAPKLPPVLTVSGIRGRDGLDVFPRTVRQDIRDGALGKAETRSEAAKRDATSRPKRANLAHRVCGQLGAPLRFPDMKGRRSTTTLASHVRDVLGVRSNAEMIRADARRVIAYVHDFETIGHLRVIVENPRVFMGGRTEGLTAKSEVPVAVVAGAAYPGPAAVNARSIDAPPEFLSEFLGNYCFPHGSILPRAECARATS